MDLCISGCLRGCVHAAFNASVHNELKRHSYRSFVLLDCLEGFSYIIVSFCLLHLSFLALSLNDFYLVSKQCLVFNLSFSWITNPLSHSHPTHIFCIVHILNAKSAESSAVSV